MTGVGFDAGTQGASVTVAPEVLFHYVSDDELHRVRENVEDPAKDICLVALGGFLGAAVPAADALHDYAGTGRLSFVGLVALAVALMTMAVAATMGYQWRNKRESGLDIIAKIMSRPKVPVRITPETPVPVLDYVIRKKPDEHTGLDS